MHAEMGCRYAAPLGGARTTIVFNGNVFKHQGLHSGATPTGRFPNSSETATSNTGNTGFFQRCNDSEIRAPNIF